ncbi:MAG TPA: ATP12 family protein, partial [Allosphingosinicella sp.]|nr:ATP12 family protein [Allosphingosinicella sp.]
NAAIDRVASDPEAFAAGLAVYAESDLLCYRADTPAALVEWQERHWDPLLSWARRRFDVDFEVVAGIMHRPQPEMTLRQLGQALRVRTTFELAAMSPLITISGSLVIALALAEDAVDLDTGWAAATVDEAWQFQQWGEDADAARVLEARRRDFEAAYRFLKLL